LLERIQQKFGFCLTYTTFTLNNPSMASSTSFSSDVVAYREQLRYYALSLTANLEEANDLVQETMLKAFTHESRFQPDTNLKAWLYTILRNIFINNYRRSIKFRSIVDLGTDIGQAELPQSSKDAFNPESAFRYKEIYSEMDALPEDFRIPLKMYFEGFKYKEIADELNLPIGTIKSRIFLARKQVAIALADPQAIA
jgi:RNA polymerase sigma-70 factor, ECF subfamily